MSKQPLGVEVIGTEGRRLSMTKIRKASLEKLILTHIYGNTGLGYTRQERLSQTHPFRCRYQSLRVQYRALGVIRKLNASNFFSIRSRKIDLEHRARYGDQLRQLPESISTRQHTI